MQTMLLPNYSYPDGVDFSQFFGLWSIEASRAMGLADYWTRSGQQHMQTGVVEQATVRNATIGKDPQFALIEAVGPLTKRGSSLSDRGSMLRIRRELNNAAADDSIDGILLKIDSPGGTAAGTQDTSDAVARAAEKKPVVVYGEDLMASAAYSIGSQGTKVVMNAGGFAGSIGTFAVVVDASQAAEDQGYKVHVIRAGEFKGAGVLGTEVTDEQLAEFQRVVNDTNQDFRDTVTRGRGLSGKRLDAVADGRVFKASEAVELGLIDQVGTLEDAFSLLEDLAVSDKTQAATLSELKQALPNATSDELVQYLGSNLSLADAQEFHAMAVAERTKGMADELKESQQLNAEMSKQMDKMRAEIDELKAKKPGLPVELAETSTDEPEDYEGRTAKEEYKRRAEKLMSEKGWSREKAWAHVANLDPDLRDRYIEEGKENRRRAEIERLESYSQLA